MLLRLLSLQALDVCHFVLSLTDRSTDVLFNFWEQYGNHCIFSWKLKYCAKTCYSANIGKTYSFIICLTFAGLWLRVFKLLFLFQHICRGNGFMAVILHSLSQIANVRSTKGNKIRKNKQSFYVCSSQPAVCCQCSVASLHQNIECPSSRIIGQGTRY